MGTYARTQEVEHLIGPAGRFALVVTSPDVEITGVDEPIVRARITIEIQAGSDAEADEALEHAQFTVTRGEGRLAISEPGDGKGVVGPLGRLLGRPRYTVTSVEVSVPHGAELEYEGVSADVTGRKLTGQQRYTTVSGDLVLDGVGGALRIQGVSADVCVRAEAPVGLEANSVSGDLSVFAPAFDALRVVTVSGDVEVEGELRPNDPHRVETVSGDFSLGLVGGVSLEVRGLSSDVDVDLPHRSEGSRDRRRYIVADGGAQLLFSSMSGDVSVGRARRLQPGSQLPVPADASAVAERGSDEEQLAVLQALERGEIDVEEAARRLGGTPDG